MIKAWCETCNGKKVIENGKVFANGEKDFGKCPDCNGKGYTEHDGSLEDLELAQAVRMAFNSGLFLAYTSSQDCICASSITDSKKLVESYKKTERW